MKEMFLEKSYIDEKSQFLKKSQQIVFQNKHNTVELSPADSIFENPFLFPKSCLEMLK